MRKLNKPILNATIVYPDCLGGVGSAELRNRLVNCQPLIIDAETEFDNKITKGEIHTIVRETVINGNVSSSELKNVYTAQMVQNPRGRVYYDELIQAAPSGLCPLCAHRDATTLDHYLPKSKYPRLSVVPINLIPACKDCNTGKLSDYPTTPEEETLHPYYDDIDNVTWLKARVNRTNPVSLTFYVERPVSWDDLLFARVESHFDSFHLKNLYAVQAARRLSGLKKNLNDIFSSGAGSNGIVRYLLNEANSNAAVSLNSWETSMYRGLQNDAWFCGVGFRQIG